MIFPLGSPCWALGWSFILLSFHFFHSEFIFPPKACYTEGGLLANSLCSLGNSWELWLLSGSRTEVCKALTRVQWHLLFTLIKHLSHNLLGTEAEGFSKMQMRRKAKAISLCWEKLNVETGPKRVRRGENIKREGMSYLNLTVFCAVQARLKALLEKHLWQYQREILQLSVGVSQWVKHLPPEQPEPLPCAGRAAALAQLWHSHTGCSAPLSLLERAGSNPFQRNDCPWLEPHSRESCYKPSFLSSASTDSPGLVTGNAVPICRTAFVWVLGQEWHWHSHSHSPKAAGTWQGVLCRAPGLSQGVADWKSAPSGHQISKLSWNNSSALHPASLPQKRSLLLALQRGRMGSKAVGQEPQGTPLLLSLDPMGA